MRIIHRHERQKLQLYALSHLLWNWYLFIHFMPCTREFWSRKEKRIISIKMSSKIYNLDIQSFVRFTKTKCIVTFSCVWVRELSRSFFVVDFFIDNLYKMSSLRRFRLITFDITDTLIKFRTAPGKQYGEIGSLFGITHHDHHDLVAAFRSNW